MALQCCNRLQPKTDVAVKATLSLRFAELLSDHEMTLDVVFTGNAVIHIVKYEVQSDMIKNQTNGVKSRILIPLITLSLMIWT